MNRNEAITLLALLKKARAEHALELPRPRALVMGRDPHEPEATINRAIGATRRLLADGAWYYGLGLEEESR